MAIKRRICEALLRFTSLWFDWLKWLIMTGAITLIADRTQEIMVVYVMYATYIILTIYIIIFTYKILNFVLLTIYSFNNKKWAKQIKEWTKQRDSLERVAIITSIIQIPVYISSVLISMSIVNYWYRLMHDIVLKFQLI